MTVLIVALVAQFALGWVSDETSETFNTSNAGLGWYPNTARQRSPEAINLESSARWHNASGTTGRQFIFPDADAYAALSRRATSMTEAETQKESFAICKRHNALDIFEKVLNEGWSLDKVRDAVLARRESPPIPGIGDTANYRAGGSVGREINVPFERSWRQRSAGGYELTVGEKFTNSAQFREAAKQKGGRPRFEINIDDEYQFRASNPLSISSESLTSIAKQPGVVTLEQQALTVAQLFSQAVTDGLTVRYITQDTFTNDAAAVAEGAAKPATSLDVSEVDATVRKIAVTTKTTMEMVQDFPAMQNFINNQLALQVQLREDVELLNGTGLSNRIKGVLNFSGIQTVTAASNPFDAVERGKAYVRGANGSGFAEPDAIVVHPLDYLSFVLSKDANGQYYGGGPFSGPYGGPPIRRGFLWDLPCAITTSIARGTMLVGAFRLGGTIFRRMGLTVSSTDSNEADFLSNLICVRAEERLTLAIFKPANFCTITDVPLTL